MKKYNENNHCPKCNGEIINTSYEKMFDSITRTCERCGYRWDEEPLVLE